MHGHQTQNVLSVFIKQALLPLQYRLLKCLVVIKWLRVFTCWFSYVLQSITAGRDFVPWVVKKGHLLEIHTKIWKENATSEIISTHCFFQTHTFQNAPTLINGPRSRKKVRLISRSCIVCSYSGKHSTNRYTMVNRICFPAHMRSFSFPILQGPGSFFTPRFPEE